METQLIWDAMAIIITYCNECFVVITVNFIYMLEGYISGPIINANETALKNMSKLITHW